MTDAKTIGNNCDLCEQEEWAFICDLCTKVMCAYCMAVEGDDEHPMVCRECAR